MLEGGPWTYDNHLLILHKLAAGEIPSAIPLFFVDFWVQVYELPVGYMSMNIGKQLGNFIGEFVEYDNNNSSSFWRNYMRSRVTVDVRLPLKRCKKIKKPGGEWFIVKFKYEKLSMFCFICDCLGYRDCFCGQLFSLPVGEFKKEWALG